MEKSIALIFLLAGILAAAGSALKRARREYLVGHLLSIRRSLPDSGRSSGSAGKNGDLANDGDFRTLRGARLGRWLRPMACLSRRLPLPVGRQELEKAGLELTPGEFQAARLLLFMAVLLLTVILGGPALACLSALPAALFSWHLPLIILKRKQARRQEHVSEALPDVLDMLTLLLLTGLSLKNALPRAVACSRGPLRDEFDRIFFSMELGMPRQQALALLEARNGSEDLRRFVRAVQRAERFGAPLSSSMEHLASEMRNRHKSRLREKAHKAPIKILFPLVFLILPSFLLLTVGGMVLGGGFP